jgi:hypothetical protein
MARKSDQQIAEPRAGAERPRRCRRRRPGASAAANKRNQRNAAKETGVSRAQPILHSTFTEPFGSVRRPIVRRIRRLDRPPGDGGAITRRGSCS